jgi:hypothetical protein
VKIINVRGHNHIRFFLEASFLLLFRLCLGLGLRLRQRQIMIFSRWRKNNRKVGIESCYALDEVEEGGTNLSERGPQHDNHRSLLDCVLIKVSKL